MSYDEEFYLDGDEGAVASDQRLIQDAPYGSVLGATQDRPAHKSGLPLYIDIETQPDQSRLASFNLPPVPDPPTPEKFEDLPDPAQLISGTADSIKDALKKFVAPDTWLDALTAAEKAAKDRKGVYDEIKKARNVRQDAIDAQGERIKLLSTTPEYCAICAIGWASDKDIIAALTVGAKVGNLFGADDADIIVTERMILEIFWKCVATHSPLIGYHIAGFDIPVILARSAILGIPTSRQLDLNPWGPDICDLYLKRFGARGNTSRDKPGKLKELCALYGIEVPAGDVDGSQVYELMQTPEGRQKVGMYVASDTHILREMHRKLAGYFWV